jgi:hypothetical protein
LEFLRAQWIHSVKFQVTLGGEHVKNYSEIRADEIVTELVAAKRGHCVAYGFDSEYELKSVIWPLLLGEIRRRNISVILKADTIVNERGGYLFLYSKESPSYRNRLLGRKIVAGNALHERLPV